MLMVFDLSHLELEFEMLLCFKKELFAVVEVFSSYFMAGKMVVRSLDFEKMGFAWILKVFLTSFDLFCLRMLVKTASLSLEKYHLESLLADHFQLMI